MFDLIQTCLATWDGFQWFVSGWGTLSKLNVPYSAPMHSPLMNAVAALVVQSYYCWRIYILSGIVWWPAVLAVVSPFFDFQSVSLLTVHAR